MGSHTDRKTRKSPDEQKEGHVVEDERGHQIWQGTIDTIKLSLMKTGVFYQSEAQRRLMKLREAGTDDGSGDLDDELGLMDDDRGFDPYDSTQQ